MINEPQTTNDKINKTPILSRFFHSFKIVYGGRFMTCYLVKRIGGIPFVGGYIKRGIQFFCGLIGHTYDADWGYGGGETADVWCRFCDHFDQIPKTSIWFRKRESRAIMNLVGKETEK